MKEKMIEQIYRNMSKCVEQSDMLSVMQAYWDAVGVEYGEYDDKTKHDARYDGLSSHEKLTLVSLEIRLSNG